VSVSVRAAGPADTGTLAALSAELSEVLRSVGNPVAACLDEPTLRSDAFGAAPAVAALVAECDGEAAGYLLHHPAYDPDLGGRTVAVVDLFVRERFRRRGVGRALLEAAAARAGAGGARALVWWVREANDGAIAFYERLGARSAPGVRSMHLPLPPR
jgi:GNAT superfamily N-acetyltransferase